VNSRDNALKSRIQPYVSLDVYQRLAAYASRRNLTESAVVERALREHLDGVGDLTLLYQRLDRINRSIERLSGTVTFGVELLNQFLELWLRSTPQLSAEDLRSNKAVAERRHKNILDRVRAALTSGRAVLDQRPTDDPELPMGTGQRPRPEHA
jgi:predicted DNA-binding protein